MHAINTPLAPGVRGPARSAARPPSRGALLCGHLAADTCVVGGIPAINPVRTAVDVLRWLPPHMGLAIADAWQPTAWSRPRVSHCGDFPASRGIRQARYLAGLVEPRTESFGESWLRLPIVDAGFPRPTAQVEVLDGRDAVSTA